MENIELTILMPCLNEEQTIEICIKKAQKFLNENNVVGEVLSADNGSTDNSKVIAKNNGARIVEVPIKGYGSALINGSKQAKGKYTIMGDCDDSYNFLELMPILESLRNGAELVVGNRYTGNMGKGSMKPLHRFIGTPLISAYGRLKYKIPVKDFNCGLRGYETQKINNLNCKCEGMEYATEMLIKAKKGGLKIKEVPINFCKDGREKCSHLNTFRDGMRHLRVLLGKY